MENRKALISNVLALVLFVVLLNIDSLIIKEETGLIVFRGTYISIYIVLFVYSIIRSTKTGYIPGIFNPIIKRKNEFPESQRTIIGISITIGLIILAAFAFFILIYVY